MPGIRRRSDAPYRWEVEPVDLAPIANQERRVPRSFIDADGFDLSPAGLRWLGPLIEGQAPPPYLNGLPDYRLPDCPPVARRLGPYCG